MQQQIFMLAFHRTYNIYLCIVFYVFILTYLLKSLKIFLKNDRGQESKINLRWSKDKSYRITFSNYIYVEGILLHCSLKNYTEKLINQQTMLTQIILIIM